MNTERYILNRFSQ